MFIHYFFLLIIFPVHVLLTSVHILFDRYRISIMRPCVLCCFGFGSHVQIVYGPVWQISSIQCFGAGSTMEDGRLKAFSVLELDLYISALCRGDSVLRARQPIEDERHPIQAPRPAKLAS